MVEAATAINGIAWSVGRSVCLLVTTVSVAKWLNHVEVPFACGLRNIMRG